MWWLTKALDVGFLDGVIKSIKEFHLNARQQNMNLWNLSLRSGIFCFEFYISKNALWNIFWGLYVLFIREVFSCYPWLLIFYQPFKRLIFGAQVSQFYLAAATLHVLNLLFCQSEKLTASHSHLNWKGIIWNFLFNQICPFLYS